MEEAYAQLYQEFVRLRTLCLRQASLLQQLTSALKQQQGETSGDLRDIASMPGRLDSEYPVYLSSATTPPSLPSALTTTASCGNSNNSGKFSDLLALDMSTLSMDTMSAQRKDPKTEFSVPQTLTSQMTLSPEVSYNVVKHQLLSQNGEDNGLPVPGCPVLCPDVLPQPGAAMISDVALQSQVCEFCQAVFPGDTTTRGQYLQHIYTHIT